MFGVQSNCVLYHVTCARYSDNYYAIAKVRQFKQGCWCKKHPPHLQNGHGQIKNCKIKINDQKKRIKITFVETIKVKCGNILYMYI